MTNRSAVSQPPKLLLEATLRRRPFFRKALLAALGLAVALVALYAVNEANTIGTLPEGFWLPGIIIAIITVLLFAISLLTNLWRWLRGADEVLRFYDQGFVWTHGNDTRKYGWSALQAYRETKRMLYLTMKDGKIIKIGDRHGDVQNWAFLIRKRAARVTGTLIARAIREEQPFRLHKQLTVWPGGVEVNKQEIPWSELDVRLKDSRLTVYRRAESGKFRTVKQFNAQTVENVGGFLELAHSTIKNHQRERFGV
ncbi:MAG: YcxB family protein [Anaerolineae bacterium]